MLHGQALRGAAKPTAGPGSLTGGVTGVCVVYVYTPASACRLLLRIYDVKEYPGENANVESAPKCPEPASCARGTPRTAYCVLKCLRLLLLCRL